MKQFQMILILLFFLSIIIGANFYLSQRFAWFFGFVNVWPLYLVFAVFSVFMIGGVMGASNSIKLTGHFTYMIAAFLMGFLLYLLISTIAIDLLGYILKLKPVLYGISSIVLALLISAYGIINANKLKVNHLTIPIEGLSTTIKAAHLTDTHLGHFRSKKTLSKIVDAINQNNVDVIFFTGDLFDGKIRISKETLSPLHKLNAPIFFVEGNHDEYSGISAIKNLLKETGIVVLENEVVQWRELQIIGLNFMPADEKTVSPHASQNGPNVKRILNSINIDKKKPAILLHHGPDGIKYAQQAGIDLYLAGHTHGGQLWPITFIAKKMFEYNKGLHNYKGTKIYVCQGTGTFGPPMRIGTQSELAILSLK